jgi:hypothetical protein
MILIECILNLLFRSEITFQKFKTFGKFCLDGKSVIYLDNCCLYFINFQVKLAKIAPKIGAKR